MQWGCCLHFLLRCGTAHTCCPSVAKPSPCNNHTSATKVHFIGKWMNGLRNCCSTPFRATQILRAWCNGAAWQAVRPCFCQSRTGPRIRSRPRRGGVSRPASSNSPTRRRRIAGSDSTVSACRNLRQLSWRADRACRLFSLCHKMFPCRFNATGPSVQSTGCLGSSIGRAVDS